MQEKKSSDWKAERQRKVENFKKNLWTIFVLAGLAVAFWAARDFVSSPEKSSAQTVNGEIPGKPDIDVQLLTVNDYSRPGIALEQVNAVVVHYTANPGSSAQANRDYFENLQYTQTTMASSHFIVGLDREIVQCVPTAEIAYASNDRNWDTVSIETCHPDESGQYTDATYESLVHLTAWLCKKFDLTSDQVIRHYDVTGKICPKYFVEDESAWEQFKADVGNRINEL